MDAFISRFFTRIRRKTHSLSFLLLLCIGVISATMLFAVYYFYYSFRSAQETHIRETYNLICSDVERDFTKSAAAAETIANAYGTDQSIQDYLFNIADDSSIVSYSNAMEVMNYASRLTEYSFSALYFYANTGRSLISDESYADYFWNVVKSTHLDTNVNIRYSYIVPVKASAAGNSYYLIYVFPFQKLSYGEAEETNAEAIQTLYCMVLVDPDTLITNISNTDETAGIALMSNQHLLTSSRYLSEEETSLIKEVAKGQDSYTTKTNEKYLTEKFQVSNQGYSLVYFIPEKTLGLSLAEIRNTFLIVVSIIFLTSLIICSFILNSIRRSMHLIVDELNRTQAGSGSATIHHSAITEPKLQEFRIIASAVNQMLTRIEHTQKAKEEADRALMEASIEQRKAEMTAYRSQINPHFIFNSLETMRSMAQYVNEVPLSEMITALSSMLRHVLYSSSYTTLKKEAQCLSDYMEIISIRFGEDYRFLLQISPDTENARCLCMMLQPFVENSIRYAFSDFSKKGTPTILVASRLNHENNRLIVDIIDNGKGMTQEQICTIEKNIRSRTPEPEEDVFSIGLANVYKRLKLAYGEHCHLRIFSSYGHYTKIEIQIPQNPDLM